jgi:putative peptide zinc metalloprotease protein
VFAEAPARIEAVLVSVGEPVTAGQTLMRLAAPELEFQHAALAARARAQEWALANQGFDDEVRGRNQVLEQERRSTLARLGGLDAKLARLDVRAPMDSMVVEVPDTITPGIWVKAGEPLARLARPGPSVVEALIAEDDLARIGENARAIFHPEAPDRPVFKGRVIEIDGTATRSLSEPHLASTYGGKVAVRSDPKNGQLVPETILYRVRIMLDDAPPLQPVLRGTAVIEGRPASTLDRIVRAAMAVLIRESGA